VGREASRPVPLTVVRSTWAGGNTTINGTSCKGSLRAFKLTDGSFVWQACLQWTVMGAGSEVPGVLAVVDGSNLTLVNSGTGVTLFDNSNKFYGSLSILNGVL
jgi:hypothetical protein